MEPNERSQSPKSRYQILDKIGEGGMGAVYRVVDRLNQVMLALKEVHISVDDLEFERSQGSEGGTLPMESSSSLALANEFQLLATLRHPYIISVIDYGFDELGQPFFTMDLLDQPTTILEAAKGQPIQRKIQLILQMLQALEYLHRRQIIHRDLKPDNVLVTADGTVKVVDFGLAIDVEALRRGEDDDAVKGTLAYIAPEVLLQRGVSVQSDLYAVGLILYEVLTEQRAYQWSSVSELISLIVQDTPDISALDVALQPIATRLLMKDPADRYGSATEVIEAICDAVGINSPAETLMIRESFLQAAQFIGRDEELAALVKAVRTIDENETTIYLVGGESGVGKSRLLNEARVRALVQKTVVLRGQAVNEASTPYHIWRDTLKWLAFVTPLDDATASLFSQVIPDLDEMLDRAIEPPPDTAPELVRDRLQEAIIQQLHLLQEPTIIVLEDLQWAGAESLGLLRAIGDRIQDRPLLIIGSYRSDEFPNLPESIPSAQTILLERLDGQSISKLGESMLGATLENSELIAFLEEETNGNVYFVIELLRAMSEDRASLREIAAQPIPDEIVAGGMLAILQRRLSRVPEEFQRLLEYAALIGRELNLELLQHLLPDERLAQFTQTSADLAILEAQETGWRFAHDKLREEVVRRLRKDGSAYRRLHQDIAGSAEALYEEQPDYLPMLAHHWTEADIPQKAVIYLEKAGLQMTFWDYERSAQYIERAISLDIRAGAPSQKRQIQRHSALVTVYHHADDNPASIRAYQSLLSLLGSSPLPTSNIGLTIRLIRELLTQVRNRLLSRWFVGTKDNSLYDQFVYYALLNVTSVFQYQGKVMEVLVATFIALNMTERVEANDEINPSLQYAALGYLGGMLGTHWLARTYFKLAEDASEQTNEFNQALVDGLVGVYAFHTGDLETAAANTQVMLSAFDAQGNYNSVAESRNMEANVLKLRGQFEEAQRVAIDSYEFAKQRGYHTPRFLLHMTAAYTVLQTQGYNSDRFADLAYLLDEEVAERAYEKSFEDNKAYRAYYQATSGIAKVSLDQPEEAIAHLEKSLVILSEEDLQRTYMSADLYLGLGMLCELLFRSGQRSDTLRKHYQQVSKYLDQFAKIFVPAQSAAARHRAWLDYFTGKEETVLAKLAEAVTHAQQIQLPYDEMMAQIAIAEISPERRSKASQRARQLAETINAPIALQWIEVAVVE